MSFQLLPSVNENKIFMVKRSDLEDRLDPVMALYQRKNTQFKYRTEHFSSLLKSNPQYGASEAGKTRLSVDDPRYIRITDIDKYGLLKNEIGKTAETIAPRYILKNNDILIARSGATVGKSYIHKINNVDYLCFYAGYMIRFIVDDEKINPDYIFTYTQLGVYGEWVSAIQRSAGQPNINAEEYKSLKIPIPPTEIQDQIVAKIDAAYTIKKQRETEAQRLLDSIDDYLLGELGFELQETKKNTINQRIFKRKFSEVVGRRFDPLYYFENIYQTVDDAPYETVNLANATHYLRSGFAAGKQDQSNNIDDIIQIRPTNINLNREFDFSKNVYINKTNLIDRKNDILKCDEVLFNNTNSQELVGKTILFDLDGTYFCSNHITRILPKKEIITGQYLTALLNLYQRRQVFFKICTNWNNQSGVNVDVLGKIKIPVPPLKKQNEIAKHLISVRMQAKQLQHDAIKELDNVKKEVEIMILGD